MKCSKVLPKLSAYQDGELEPKEQEQVKIHLLSCRTCRDQFAELQRVWHALEELQKIQPDPWFYRQVVRKIKERRKERFWPALQPVLRLFGTPVTISIILMIGLLIGTYLGGILTRCDLLPFQNPSVSDLQGVFTSMRVFDSAPPGTLAHGYLEMASY